MQCTVTTTVADHDLEADYRAVARDTEAEAEALGWIETRVDEALN